MFSLPLPCLCCSAMFSVAGVEQRFYRSDPDCIAARKPLVEFDLYQSTVLPLEDKGIRCRAIFYCTVMLCLTFMIR